MLFITKNATIRLVKKKTGDSWRESGRTKTELGTELCIFCGERNSREHLCAVGEFHSGSSTNNQHVKKLTES